MHERDQRLPRTLTWRLFALHRSYELILALPFLALSLIAPIQELSIETRNHLLLEEIGVVAADAATEPISHASAQPNGLLPRMIAGLLPEDHALMLLSVFGALLAGRLLFVLFMTLWQDGASYAVTIVILIALGCTPVFAYTAVTDFSMMLALVFFTSGVAGAMRMAVWRDTQAGFRAGFLLLLAGLTDTLATLLAALLAVAVPFLTLARRGYPGLRRAHVSVLLFPLAAALTAWTLYDLRFAGGSDFLDYMVHAISSPEERWAPVVELFSSAAGVIVYASFIAAVLLIPLRWRLAPPLGALVVMLTVLVGNQIGLISTATAGVTYIFTMILGAIMYPRPYTARATIGFTAVMTFSLALVWWGSLHHRLIIDWIVDVVALQGLN